MADEQYRWLDLRTAELLLRGASLESVDPAVRDQAERLAKTLEGLTAEPPPSSTGLPGEDAALAAFRAARSGSGTAAPEPGRHAEPAATGPRRPAGPAPAGPAPSGPSPSGPPSSDAGVIRIGGYTRDHVPGDRRSRRARSARYVLTAVLAAGLLGGAAFAATSGLFPASGGNDPGPGASVSADVGPNRPLVSPSPDGGTLGKPTPDDTRGGAGGSAAPPGSSGAATSARPGSDVKGGVGRWWSGAPSACGDVRDGKELTADRRRALENAAGGSDPRRVSEYCKRVLALTDGLHHKGRGKDRDRDGKGEDGPGGTGDHNGPGGQNSQGDGDQGDQGGDDDGHILPGGTGGDGTQSAPRPLLPRQLIKTPLPTPSSTPSPAPSTL